MKSNLIILTFLFLLINTATAQDKKLNFYGQIINSNHDTLNLSNQYGTYTAVTNSRGIFKFSEVIKNPDFLNLKIRNHNLTMFLLGGDTLEMNCNIDDFPNSVNFIGNRAELNKSLIPLSSGCEAPEFSLKDINGNQVRLSGFKGKYLYIDVWNSSCRPCFKEFPKMEELIEKYNGKDIVFIGISLDKNEKTWKRTIKRKHLGGIQLFGNGWKSDFAIDYFIKFNPRFILLDKNQKILYLSAPRPTGGIEQTFDKILGL